MQEFITEQDELVIGAVGITLPDRDSEKEYPQSTELPRASVRRSVEYRLPVCAAASVLGIVVGVAIALFFPLEGVDISNSVAASGGDFITALLSRVVQCGAFLTAEYLLGYFAGGGVVVWAVPMIFSMGAGLSVAGGVAAGGSALMILPAVIFIAVLVAGASASWEFSSVLLRLLSGNTVSVVTRGNASHFYDMRFGIYLAAIFAVSIAEAAVKACQ